MVNAYQLWHCGECGAPYETEQEAEECCADVVEPEEEVTA